MPRRQRAEERHDGHDSIDLLRGDTGGAGTNEIVRTGTGVSRSVGIAFAAIATVGIAVLALRSTSDEGPAPPTIDPEAAIDAEPARETEALLGQGPDLDWEQIIWNIGTGDFRWIDDAFVGENGVTEWRITPTLIDTAIQQRQSLQLAWPDHYPIDAEGAQVLAPRVDQPDHLLFFTDGGSREPVRVDVPMRSAVTDLVTRRAEIQAAVVGDAGVIVIERFDQVNPATFGPRIGVDLVGRDPVILSIGADVQLRLAGSGAADGTEVVTVAVADLDLTASELEALRPRGPQLETLAVDLTSGTTGPPGIVPDGVAQLGVAGDQFVLAWANGDVAGHVSTSRNGRSWRPSASRVGITSVSGDATSIVGIETTSGDVSRSGDGAVSWRYTAKPFPKYDLTVTRDHVAVRELSAGRDGLDPNARYEIGLDGYDLAITGGGTTFELVDSATGDVVSGGRIGDPVTGAAYDPYGGGLTVIDPVTGETITVSSARLAFAFATTGGSADRVPLVGFARWDGGLPARWRIEPVDEVFGSSAVGVDFVSGGGHLLAVVTTRNGYTFFITEIE